MRREPVSHAASCISASVWFRQATSMRRSTKSNVLAVNCCGAANSVQATHTRTWPTQMVMRSKPGMSEPAALGFRTHSGWTIVLAVAGSPRNPVVLERRRIETADPAIPGSKQPYHAAERLGLQQAETLIRRCRDSSTVLARDAVSAMIVHLEQRGHRVVGAGLLFASGRQLPGLAATLRSHTLIHTAEGEFFREALARASELCSLPLTKVKERELWDRSAKVFHLGAADLE